MNFKNHLMFILPLMAILLGIEFFFVFDRVTKSYEESLTKSYTMFVSTKKPMKFSDFKALDSKIATVELVKRDYIENKMKEMINRSNMKKSLKLLPYFYNLGLESYLKIEIIEEIKKELEKNKNIITIETFSNSYTTSYKLFSFIKLIFNIFIIFMIVVSLLLILKQMEIWKFKHKERMKIMEIFGASVFMRSRVLFIMALIDALLSTLFVSAIFILIKIKWAMNSGIEMISKHQEFLFTSNDVIILFSSAILIVLITVYIVVFSSKGTIE